MLLSVQKVYTRTDMRRLETLHGLLLKVTVFGTFSAEATLSSSLCFPIPHLSPVDPFLPTPLQIPQNLAYHSLLTRKTGTLQGMALALSFTALILPPATLDWTVITLPSKVRGPGIAFNLR